MTDRRSYPQAPRLAHRPRPAPIVLPNWPLAQPPRHFGRPSRPTYAILPPAPKGNFLFLSQLSRINHELVLACVSDSGKFTYKRTRRGNAEIDQAVAYVLQRADTKYEIVNSSPYGYHERQFCSSAFNLPVGCFMRTPHGRFPEYHTSADNLDLVHTQTFGLVEPVFIGPSSSGG